MKACKICKEMFSESDVKTPFVEAGEWLADEVWDDAGELCPRCLESRGKLAMMYMHEHNT
jgi:hypothetical protein